MRKTLFLIAILCTPLGLTAQAPQTTAALSLADEDLVTVRSPDGRIVFRLFNGPPPDSTAPLPRLAYQVDFQGKPVIDTSYLGYEIFSAVPLGDKLSLTKATSRTVDEAYTVPAGKVRTVRNYYNETIAEYIQNGSTGRLLTLEVRAFNDGVAFRYWVPQSPPLEDMLIENEITQFVFTQDATAYPLLLRHFQTGYEDQYTKTTLSGIHPESIIGLPLLVEQPGVGWVAISEADLDEYAGLYLRHEDGRTLRAQLSPRLDGSTLAVHLRTPLASPWRVLMIADQPYKLIESTIIPNLNAPSAIADTSWIKPGKAIQASASIAAINDAVDFAAQSGFEYVLAATSWSASGLPALIARAAQKNVGLWLTASWIAVDAEMDMAFPLMERMGVRGLKIEGMNRDDQYMVDFYRRAARKAAQHHLMLDFHDAFKPDGMERTWPNVLTREAVLGLEYAPSGSRANAEHDVMLAFTRLLAGPMDYTPGGFNLTLSTRAHQLALFVLFESPLQTAADPPAAYRNQREFEFIKAVPATWDETRAISGVVGEYVAVARRRGSEWFLGVITNRSARDLEVPLTFLGPGDYTAEIYADESLTQRSVNNSISLRLHLASGGGSAIRFRPR